MRSGRVGSIFSDPALTGRAVDGMPLEGESGMVLGVQDGIVVDGVVEGYDWNSGGGEVIELSPGQVIPGQIIIE